MEREGQLEIIQYDLLFLVKQKQWDIFWRLFFFIFSKHVVEQNE